MTLAEQTLSSLRVRAGPSVGLCPGGQSSKALPTEMSLKTEAGSAGALPAPTALLEVRVVGGGCLLSVYKGSRAFLSCDQPSPTLQALSLRDSSSISSPFRGAFTTSPLSAFEVRK